jgi:hypothetical protein
MKPEQPDRVTPNRSNPSPVLTGTPPRSPYRRPWGLWAALGALLLVGLGVGAYLFVPDLRALLASRSATPAPRQEELLCQEFINLKNAGDPRADHLLGPPPVIPGRAVSRREADRLDAEFILRQPFRVTEVRPLPARGRGQETASPRFVLVAKGSITSERFLVEGSAQPSQRMLFNPDIIVEVRDGRLHGVRAQLHED